MDQVTIESGEEFLLILAFIFMFAWFVSVFLFTRITLKYVECEMKKIGAEPPEWDKGIGGRIMVYASVLIWQRRSKTPLVNEDVLLKVARPIDRKISIFLYLSFFNLLIVSFIWYFLYG